MTYITRLPRLTMVLRIILGLFMCATGVMMFVIYASSDPAEFDPAVPFRALMKAVMETGYLFQFVATFKLTTGLLVLIPRTAPGAVLGALAFYSNVVLMAVFLMPFLLVTAAPAFLVTSYLVWAFWDRYRHMIARSAPA